MANLSFFFTLQQENCLEKNRVTGKKEILALTMKNYVSKFGT